jgi:hypothetical protein
MGHCCKKCSMKGRKKSPTKKKPVKKKRKY